MSFYHLSCSSRPKPKSKKGEEDNKKEIKQKRVIDNTGRHKPIGYVAWEPVDNVYMLKFYPKPSHDVDTAVDMLKEFQRLEFTPPDQTVTLDLRLDMKLEKKVEWHLSLHIYRSHCILPLSNNIPRCAYLCYLIFST